MKASSLTEQAHLEMNQTRLLTHVEQALLREVCDREREGEPRLSDHLRCLSSSNGAEKSLLQQL